MAIRLTVLVTDMLPAVSFMYEIPESDLMKKRPRNIQEDRLITSEYDDMMKMMMLFEF